jgi:hypothetical protein
MNKPFRLGGSCPKPKWLFHETLIELWEAMFQFGQSGKLQKE